MIFHADSESDLKTSPNHVKTRCVFENWVEIRAAASAEGFFNPLDRLGFLEPAAASGISMSQGHTLPERGPINVYQFFGKLFD